MIRVLVVDDHEWIRDALAALLDAAGGMTVVGTGADGHSAVVEAERLRPHVVTLDIVMPGMDGLTAAGHLRDRHPAGRVIMLAAAVPGLSVARARALGAAGYLLKDGDPDELVAAVRAAGAGGEWWCRRAALVLRHCSEPRS